MHPPADERANGATWSLDQVGWLDFESRAPVDVKSAGATRYATQADAVILAYAIGNGPVRTISVRDFSQPLDLVDLPTELLAHHAKVVNGTAVWAAWNAAFDRAVWNYATLAFPIMKPEYMIDVMAQAVASGLPPDLATASGMAGMERKAAIGKSLIQLFCLPGATATPQSHPEKWAEFLSYAGRDIEAMRSVFLHTRQLTLAEWREYWAMETINERGARIDLSMVKAAAALADEDKVRSRAELRAITGDPEMTVDMVKRMTAWLLDRLPLEGREILTKREEEVDEDGEITRPAKYALTRRQVERLIALVRGSVSVVSEHHSVLRVLQLRLYGGSKTPAKFTRMTHQHVDGVLYNQYVFNGASQTGRASSKGVQVHNLMRDVLSDEIDVITDILRGCSYDELAARGDPVARQLSLLIRPAFIPTGENVFVWSDWSQIEARVLPWLAGGDPGALARLQVFRDVDADPSVPDLYTRTAAVLSHVDVAQVDKPMRQRGKVAELALGFGGAVGALQAMGANYGLHVPADEAHQTVVRWREANGWCTRFWRELGDAVSRARQVPGEIMRAGESRIRYMFAPGYLGGSLFCFLPSGRILTYRDLRAESVAIKDDDGNVVDYEQQLRFSRGYGRIKLWHGMLCENVVQAVAADVLRGTLVRLEQRGSRRRVRGVRLHTHDEIVLECAPEDADDVALELRDTMQKGFAWSDGLPLMSEETQAYYYTKHEGSHGL